MAAPWTSHLQSCAHHRGYPLSNPFFATTFSAKPSSRSFRSPKMEGAEITEEVLEKKGMNLYAQKNVFVAGSTGSTGKRIVEQLLAKGFSVKAGARDLDKANATFSPLDNRALRTVKADVTEGPIKLAEAIGDDSDAVVCATGFRPSWDLLAPWKVDNFGTINLVEACRRLGIRRFVLVSSLLVNGAAMGQLFNPAYVFLNVFGLTLIAKLQAERHIRGSGINYTIVRPGGLRNDPPSGNIVMEPEDMLYEGSISRDQVAEVVAEALVCPEASFKVVEIVSRPEAPQLPLGELFNSVTQK